MNGVSLILLLIVFVSAAVSDDSQRCQFIRDANLCALTVQPISQLCDCLRQELTQCCPVDPVPEASDPALESPVFSSSEILATVTDRDIDEASGLAASRIHEGVLYTQNDKGDSSRIFAVDSNTGHTLAEFEIADIGNYDWEDLAVGPCGSHSCVYIAETGDHGGDGAKNIIYRVREPLELTSQTIQVDSQLKFTWNEDNCETLMVTPNEDVYLISKIEGGHGLLANFSHTGWGSGQTVSAEASAYMSQTTTKKDPVGGDISTDGKEMLVKYKEYVYYWAVLDGDYIGAISRAPVTLPYTMEDRGETVCWNPDASGYFTVGEGRGEPIYYYQRTSPLIS